MKIIDRYLLRQFLQTFVICYMSLTGLYIVFHAFTNLDEFQRACEKGGSLWAIMIPYYGCRSLFFFDRTAGMLILVSAMFTITWIQRHNELVALMSAGISRIRVGAPVILAGIAIALLATVNRELIIPRFRDELAKEPRNLRGEAARALNARLDYQTGILIRGESTIAKEQRIRSPKFLLPMHLVDYARQLSAQDAYYRRAEADRPAGYLLDGLVQPKTLAGQPSLCVDGRPIIITPRDASDWLKPNQCFVVSDVDFEQLADPSGWRNYSSTAQLIRGLRNPSLDFGADVKVTIHGRFVQPLLDITLLFLGIPLVLSRQSRNVFIAIGVCMLVVSVFVLVTLTLQYLGGDCALLTPAQGVWAPLMIFVPIAVGMGQTMWE